MQSIRNIAIIAHVDHGKTTLVDNIIHECQALEKHNNTNTLILDNTDLERERGITILSKNVSVRYKGVKINIIDTPGHSDFGGEVERVLKMADGVLLLVDAFEGPMPQTRFVLSKALEIGLLPIVVINKVDKENCRPDEVHEEVFDLMFNLDATEEQLEFNTVYGSSKLGWMSNDWRKPTNDIKTLLDLVLQDIPQAQFHDDFIQLQITSMDYSKFTGRIAIGKLNRGILKSNTDVSLCKKNNIIKKVRIKELYVFEGLGKEKVQSVRAGDLCAIIGVDEFEIGDTISDIDDPKPLPRIKVDEPTMSMLFTINTSPFFGKEGKFVTSRHLRERLYKEMEKNLALRVEDTESEDKFNVYGRGILHLSILIETMRREGYELQVGQPKVIIKNIDGLENEPFEILSVDLPLEYSGKAIEMVTQRKGDLLVMEAKNDLQHLEFLIPSRGLIGLRNQMLSNTAGKAIMNHRFDVYQPMKGDISKRQTGSIVSMESGQALAFAIHRLQDRGKFFISPGEEVYKGQVIGESNKSQDMSVNVIKGKKLTNMRASGADDAIKIIPKIQFTLEEAMEYVGIDEYLEVTPQHLRLRKIDWKNN